MGTKKAAAATGDVFPIGMTDFEKLISKGKVYIDKTSYLEELLNSGTEVALILRPRRFGKTLTMSMLSCFLEMNYQNPEDRSRPERLFKDLAIYKNLKFPTSITRDILCSQRLDLTKISSLDKSAILCRSHQILHV